MAKIISYDPEADIFWVHTGFYPNEKFDGNIDADDIVLDTSTKGRICGVEILNATQHFKPFAINEDILNQVTNAEFDAELRNGTIVVNMTLHTKKKNYPASFTAAIPEHTQELALKSA